MTLQMITIKELLRDKWYREYFSKPPKLPEHYRPDTQPWKLYILKPGETAWRSKRFGTYKELFTAFKKVYPIIDDAALNCPPLSFMPPVKTYRVKNRLDSKGKPLLTTKVWKPSIEAEMEPHYWCPHCRRPTLFRIAITAPRKMLNGFTLPSGEAVMRCIICGASENIVNLREPTQAQQWDVTRPRIY